jgi:hypothetical protein
MTVNDRLLSVADALRQFVEYDVSRLPADIRHQSTAPSFRLASALRVDSIDGDVELLRHWLEMNLSPAIAERFFTLVSPIRTQLAEWEFHALQGLARREQEALDAGLPLTPGTLFDDDQHRGYLDLIDAAERAERYVLRLASDLASRQPAAVKAVEFRKETDTETDTQRDKTPAARFSWCDTAKKAAERFKQRYDRATGSRLKPPTLTAFCKEFCQDNVAIEPSTLQKKLTQNRTKWDPEFRYGARRRKG